MISAYHYSDAHPSALNKKFATDFEQENRGMRANMMGVGAYDGMALVYHALEMTKGATDGESLLAAAQTDAVKQKLADNTAAAVARGVFGLPACFVGEEMFWGKERLGQVEEAVTGMAAS